MSGEPAFSGYRQPTVVPIQAPRRRARMTKRREAVSPSRTMALGHAILASLNSEAKTGYDLAKQFGTDGFYWRATHQQIYRELNRLEVDGLVEYAPGGPGSRGERDRLITDKGRECLATWAREPAKAASIKEDLLVKCLTLGLIPRADLSTQIAARRGHHLDRLARYEEMREQAFPEGEALDGARLGRFLALQGGISYERQWIEWAETAIRLLAVGGETSS